MATTDPTAPVDAQSQVSASDNEVLAIGADLTALANRIRKVLPETEPVHVQQEAQAPSVPSFTSYEALRDRLIALSCELQVLHSALEGGEVDYGHAAIDLHGTIEALDTLQEDLESWYEDLVKALTDGVLQACRERNLELIESLARRMADAERGAPEEDAR